MAKKKKPDRLALSMSRDIISNINKEKNFKIEGGDFFYNLKDNEEIGTPKWYVSTGSTSLDLAMTGKVEGGIPSGTMVEIFGLQQSGKSLLGLTICREAQRAGGMAAYIDSEQRFFKKFANALGVDTDTSTFMYSDVPFLERVLEGILYVNKQYRIQQLKNKNNKIPLVFVWDSLHASNPIEDYEEDGVSLGGYKTQKARILSQYLDKINYAISKSGASLVILNQLRTNLKLGPGGAGEKYVTTGGMTVQYYSSIRIKLRSTNVYKESDEELGRVMKAKVVKNSVYRPNLESSFTVMYDSGINDYLGWYDVLKANKLISISGAWSKLKIPTSLDNWQNLEEISFYKKDFEDTIVKHQAEDFIKSKVVELMTFEYKNQIKELQEKEKLKDENLNSDEE